MSFLYKRLAKLGKLAAKKDAESKYDDVPVLSLEELNDTRTDQQSNKEKEK